MRVRNRIGPKGRVSSNESGSVNILVEDCVSELPSSAEKPWGVYFFWPVGGVQVTIKCHGDDLIDGLEEVVISEDRIHAILGMGGNRFHADFKAVAPTKPVEQAEVTETPELEPVER